MKKAIIFDMDGLMIDSERATYNEYVKKLEMLGIHNFSEDIYVQCLGKNKEGICQVFYDHYGDDFPMEEVWDDVHVWLDEVLRTNPPKKKGIDDLLIYLKEHHYKTIVATSSDRERVDDILEKAGILQYFDDTICGDEVTHSKPHPEIFLTACKKMGIEPEEAIVLEDSEAGVLCGYNAGIDVICVPDMKYPAPEYISKAIAIEDSLEGVIDYLDNLQ